MIDAGDVFENGDRSRVHIAAGVRDTRLDHFAECPSQVRLAHQALLRAKSKVTRVDFQQLDQRIPITAGQTDCRAERDRDVRELFARDLGVRIAREADLARDTHGDIDLREGDREANLLNRAASTLAVPHRNHSNVRVGQ